MKEENTHLLFDGKKILISPDILPAFQFLIEIDKEVESLMGVNEKLSSIAKSHLEMIHFVDFLSNKLKENDIDFEYTFTEDPELIGKKLEYHLPLRSQMIVLFASLEVLFFLHLAFKFETSDDSELRRYAMNEDHSKAFLREYLLTEENSYFQENKERLSKIDAGKLRRLRNKLTHFFSIAHDGLCIAPALLSEQSRKFEQKLKDDKKGYITFISEKDLHSLIKGATLLRLTRWSEESERDSQTFKKKMKCVIRLVEKEGAVIVQNKDLIF